LQTQQTLDNSTLWVSIPRPPRSSPHLQRETFRDSEIAWLAGILEGEGSFLMQHCAVNGKNYYYPRITVTMTDEDVIIRVAAMFGTKAHPIKPKKGLPQYRATIAGERGVAFMRGLLPYMGGRRSSKMRALISFHETRPIANELRRTASSRIAKGRVRNDLGQFDTNTPAVMQEFAR
jgi:hypothetical protein